MIKAIVLTLLATTGKLYLKANAPGVVQVRGIVECDNPPCGAATWQLYIDGHNGFAGDVIPATSPYAPELPADGARTNDLFGPTIEAIDVADLGGGPVTHTDKWLMTITVDPGTPLALLADYGPQPCGTCYTDGVVPGLPIETEFCGACSSPCPGDVDGDCFVGSLDLGIMLGEWGTDALCSDLDRDGIVGSGDLLLTIGHWGEDCQ